MHIEINILPHHYNDGADLLVDDFSDRGPRVYLLTPADLPNEEALRNLLASEPDCIYNAVVGMLKEMAT